MEEDKPWRIFVRRTECPNVGRAVCYRLTVQVFDTIPSRLMMQNSMKLSSVFPKKVGVSDIAALKRFAFDLNRIGVHRRTLV